MHLYIFHHFLSSVSESNLTNLTVSQFECCFVFPFQNQRDQNYTVLKTKAHTMTVEGLKPGTTYVFRVRARTEGGYGNYGGEIELETSHEGNVFMLFSTVSCFFYFYLCMFCSSFHCWADAGSFRTLLLNLIWWASVWLIYQTSCLCSLEGEHGVSRHVLWGQTRLCWVNMPLIGIKEWRHILKGFGAYGKHRDLVVYAPNLKHATAQQASLEAYHRAQRTWSAKLKVWVQYSNCSFNYMRNA